MRAADTYRAARRNYCFNNHYVWGPEFYYKGHTASIKKRLHEQRKRWTQRAKETAGPVFGIFTPPALRLRRGARGQ